MNGKKHTERFELGKELEHKVQPDLNYKSSVDLLNELETKMSTMNEDNFDFELVEKHLKDLQERVPVMDDYDLTAEFARLQNDHSVLFEEDKNFPIQNFNKQRDHRSRKTMHVLRISEVAVAAVLCLTISASAIGFNPIKMFINWMDDTLQIKSGPSGVMELPDDSSVYKTLEDALESNGADTSNCPTWVPEDYRLVDVSVKSSEGTTNFLAYYASDRGDMFIRVIRSISDWTETSEKNPGGYSYESSGYEYYIVSNVEDLKAGWTNGSYSYLINGNINENEIKSIIDSIQRK